MYEKGRWIWPIVVSLCVCLLGTGEVRADLVPLHYQDFPCETIPPKCPELVGFLMQVKNLFPDNIIDIPVEERIDIDTWVCDELYIDAGGRFSVPVSGLNAELFYERNPEDEWFDHLVTNLQFDNVTLEGNATLRGRDCIGFIDFDIPMGGYISWDVLGITSRQGVWLDTATNKVELTDAARDELIGGLEFDFGLGDIIQGVLYPFMMILLPDMVSDFLLADDAIVFNLVESIMDQLYHTQPCGCVVAPTSGYRGNALTGHIALNMLPYLVPFGLVAYMKRRIRR